MRRSHLLIGLLSAALVLSACVAVASTNTLGPPTEMPALASSPESTPVPETPDTNPEPDARPPVGVAQEFSTDFSNHSVPFSEILSGGPPKDGIPAIDSPQYTSVDEADEWLDDREPVIIVQIGEVARAYPIQILTWHEIVNDTLAGEPIVVTFCPLCNTGIAFKRTFDDRILDFGTTGRLRFSNLIMYDRQTETWWQQATGAGIIGEYNGRQLEFYPANMIAWSEFKTIYPSGTVLSRDTGYNRSYGQNPYSGYDDINNSPFLYQGPETPGTLPPMARVVTIELNDEVVAYPYETLEQVKVINDTVAGLPIVVFWTPGTASALDTGDIAEGNDVGAATTYSRELGGQVLEFVWDGKVFIDAQTGRSWNSLGQSTSDPESSSQLTSVVSINHFWFSWVAFRPDTSVYQVHTATPVETEPMNGSSPTESMPVELLADFEILVYEGQSVLGGESVMFSDVFVQDKPVVLLMWAGLCPICRNEMPDFQTAYEAYGDQVLFLGIDIGPYVGLGDTDDALALVQNLNITFPTGTTPDGQMIRDYQILGTPSTLFIRPSGEVTRQWTGRLGENQLEEYILELVDVSSET